MLALRFLGAVISVLFVVIIFGIAAQSSPGTLLLGVLGLVGVGVMTVHLFKRESPRHPAVDNDSRHWNPGLRR